MGNASVYVIPFYFSCYIRWRCQMSCKMNLAVAATLGWLLPFSAQANLVTNGDFAIDASGWTYNNEGVDGGYRSIGNPGGSFWINHNGGAVGADPDPMLFQTISTTAGSQYELFFDYSGGAIVGGVGLALDLDGVETETFAITGGIGWITESLLFTATGASTTIAFRTEINGTDYDAYVDNVSVTLNGGENDVPEPATLVLIALGMIGIGTLRRKNVTS